MKFSALFLIFISLTVFPSIQQKLIWIDSDPGVDEGVLDDAIAIFVAGYNPSVKIVGITVAAGNTSPEKVEKNILNILNLAKIQVIFFFFSHI
jgi:inosine-uridine nucleoside N-ribohydrolase